MYEEYYRMHQNSTQLNYNISEVLLIQRKRANYGCYDGQLNRGKVYCLAATFKAIHFFTVEGQQLKGFPKHEIKQLHSNQRKNGCDNPNTFAQL
jgi:hypothetical protein